MESYRIHSGWDIISDTYAEQFLFSIGLFSYALHTKRYVPDMMHAYCYYIFHWRFFGLRRWYGMDSYASSCGILLYSFWVDYDYWDLCRSLPYILGKWSSIVLVMWSSSAEGSWESWKDVKILLWGGYESNAVTPVNKAVKFRRYGGFNGLTCRFSHCFFNCKSAGHGAMACVTRDHRTTAVEGSARK